AESEQEALRAGEPHLRPGPILELGVELGRVQTFEDRLDAELPVGLRLEDGLVIPQGFTVADLERGPDRIRQSGDREAEVNPQVGGLEIASLDRELLIQHIDLL